MQGPERVRHGSFTMKEELEMMTKQAELKKQAYASSLKSRALSVLIYLIDRSNKELTCFPAIPTIAEQLHISISTVKRALHELEGSGYIKKDFRFRDNNRGQTSNLYTLVLFGGQMGEEEKTPLPRFEGEDRCEDIAEGVQESERAKGQEICPVEHIGFADIKRRNEETEVLREECVQESCVQESRDEGGQGEGLGLQEGKMAVIFSQSVGRVSLVHKGIFFRVLGQMIREAVRVAIQIPAFCKMFRCLWMGEGFSLMPP